MTDARVASRFARCLPPLLPPPLPQMHLLQRELSEELQEEQEESAAMRAEHSRLKALCRSLQYQNVSNNPRSSHHHSARSSPGYGYDHD